MKFKNKTTIFSVFDIIKRFGDLNRWTIIIEDVKSDKIGTTLNQDKPIGYRELRHIESLWEIDDSVLEAMDYKAVSIDLEENVIFCTKEDINK